MEEILKSKGFKLITSSCYGDNFIRTWSKVFHSNKYEVKVYPKKNSFAIFHGEKLLTTGAESELLQILTNYKLIKTNS